MWKARIIDQYFYLIILPNRSLRFDVVVRRDEDGYYAATVPELPGCHTQAKSLDELISRIKETILLYFETEAATPLIVSWE